MECERGFDVLIIGAGPAGASALANLLPGISVAIVDLDDKLNPKGKAKLCGGLLTKLAQSLIDEIPQDVRTEPFKTKIEYHDINLNRFLSFPVPYANCDRGLFDSWLLKGALRKKDGDVLYLSNTKLIGLDFLSEGFRLALQSVQDGKPLNITARYLIDASGWRQVLRRLLGKPLAPTYNAIQITYALKSMPYQNYIAIFDTVSTPFFAWWIPKTFTKEEREDASFSKFHLAEIGSAFPKSIKGKADDLLRTFVLHLRKRGIEIGEKIEVRGCPLTRIRSITDIWLGEGNILAVGEAGGLVSPSSGDGISYALASGRAVGIAISAKLNGGKQNTHCAYNRGSLSVSSPILSSYRRMLLPQIFELRLNILKARLFAKPSTRAMLSTFYKTFFFHKVRSIKA